MLTADSIPDITLTVTSDKKVPIGDQADGQFFTAATREGPGLDSNVRPAPLWNFNGRLRNELYVETYLSVE